VIKVTHACGARVLIIFLAYMRQSAILSVDECALKMIGYAMLQPKDLLNEFCWAVIQLRFRRTSSNREAFSMLGFRNS